MEVVAGVRWLFVFLLWAALDLSGPVLFVSVEAFEESEEAAHRAQARRRERQAAVQATPAGWRIRAAVTRPSPLAAAAPRHRGPETGRGDVLKLPPSGPGSDSAPDDH